MRSTLVTWLGLYPLNATLQRAMAKVPEGNTTITNARSLAVSLLLDMAQGVSGIRNNGRGYAPRYINPSARPTWDFSQSTRDAEGAGKEMTAAICGTLSQAEKREKVSGTNGLRLHWLPKAGSYTDIPRKLGQWNDELLEAIAAVKNPVRPGRRWPRAKRRRPKNFPLLTAPRHEYQEIPHREKSSKAA
jgi:hypothetical protein